MATTGRKYPTEVGENTDSWTNPENMLNAGDGVCGYKITGALDWNLKCYLKTYGFSIPAGSTITKLTLGTKGCRNASFVVMATVSMVCKNGIIEYGGNVNETQWSNCSGATEVTISFVSPTPLPSVDDLNNETFTTWAKFMGSSLYANAKTGLIDCIWIEVEYTPPAAPSGMMDGLVQAD